MHLNITPLLVTVIKAYLISRENKSILIQDLLGSVEMSQEFGDLHTCACPRFVSMHNNSAINNSRGQLELHCLR